MYLRCVRACVVSLRECVPFVVCGVCVAGQAAGEGARQMAWMEGLGGPNGKQAGGPCRERARGSRANRGADSDCWRPAECRASVLDPLARAQPQCECARCVGMGAVPVVDVEARSDGDESECVQCGSVCGEGRPEEGALLPIAMILYS